MRVQFLILCCLATTLATPARTFKRTYGRKIEEKTNQDVKDKVAEERALNNEENTPNVEERTGKITDGGFSKDKIPKAEDGKDNITARTSNEEKLEAKEGERSLYENVNIVSSTMATLSDGPQEFTPHVISLPQINIGWPQSTVAPKIATDDERKKQQMMMNEKDKPQNVYTANIYINFNEGGEDMCYEEEDKKTKQAPTTTDDDDYFDYWYIDDWFAGDVKNKPVGEACPNGFKKLNGRCAQKKCKKGEILIGDTCTRTRMFYCVNRRRQ